MANLPIKNPVKFGEFVKSFRLQNNLNQQQFAKRAHLSQSLISKIEKSKVTNLSETSFSAIANVLGIHLDELLTTTSDTSPPTPIPPSSFMLDLAKNLQSERCILVVGPRISAYGNKSDSKAVEAMAAYIDESKKKALKKIKDNESIAAAWQLYKKWDIPSQKTNSSFRRLFVNSVRPSSIHYEISKLKPFFICSVNIDNLLEEAYVSECKRSLSVLDSKQFLEDVDKNTKDFFYAKLRGDANNWRSLTFETNKDIISHLLELADKLSIFLIGFDSNDNFLKSLINASANKNIKLFAILPEKQSITNTHDKQNLQVEYIKDQLLPSFLHKINPHLGKQAKVHDSPWGRMPVQHIELEFPDAKGKLQDFIFSDNKVAVVKAKGSSGLSSFIANTLSDYTQLSNTLIYRIEAKEWLTNNTYVLQILSNLPDDAYKYYQDERRWEAEGWDDAKEACTLARALSNTGQRIIIIIDSAHNLQESNSLDFWQWFIEAAKGDVNLILSTREELKISTNFVHIDLGAPQKDLLEKFLKQVFHGQDTNNLINEISEYNLNQFTLIYSISKIKECNPKDLVKKSISELCDDALMLLKDMSSDISNDAILEVMKTCVIFHTPRKLEWIYLCSTCKTVSDVRQVLDHACDLGLMSVVDSHIGEGQEHLYYMSSTIREELKSILFSENLDKKCGYEQKVAEMFSISLSCKLKENKSNRKMVMRLIPMISSTLFHYSQAGALDDYVSLVSEAGDYLHKIYHRNIIEDWLNAELILNYIKDHSFDSPETDYKIWLLKAQLRKTDAQPDEYYNCLEKAQCAVKKMSITANKTSSYDSKILYERGICGAMRRDYQKALQIFTELYTKTEDYYPDRNISALARLIQTNISLGDLARASDQLTQLRNLIFNIADVEKYKKLTHHCCLYYRHQSTLCTARILVLGVTSHGPSEVIAEGLLAQSLSSSEACINESKSLENARIDETGVGIGTLKKAQAFYVMHRYTEALEHSIKAANKLTNFANNRWWRMSCLDLAARSAAKLNEFKDADYFLSQAKMIFQSAGAKDKLRECELKHAEGILAYQRGKLEQSVFLFLQSLDFRSTKPVHFEEDSNNSLRSKYILSPLIEYTHLISLIKSLTELGKLDDVNRYLDRVRKLAKEQIKV